MTEDRKKPFRPGGKPTGPRKPFVERPPRDGDKPFRKPRTADGAPGEKRAFGEKKLFRPRTDRPQGDRPAFKPRGDRPMGDKPRQRRETSSAASEVGERIAKRLARAGISSRRDAEALVADGRVKVNGIVLDSPARNVTAEDRIELDGKPIPAIERTRLFLFHKPAGVVTTNRDPEGRRTVFDALPADLPRLLTVGRLDINTEGLLLLTNDGGLARVLELPATGWLRRYRVRVHGEVDEARLAGLKEGISVDGVFYGAIEASLDRSQGTNAWLTIGLREGKNREVKNVLGALGLEVTRLIRVSFGPFQLGELSEGAVHEIKGRYLRDQLGERLIEESGAMFDLPERKPDQPNERTSERPTRDDRPRESRRPDRPDREERRTEALGRLDTRPPARFGKSGRFERTDKFAKPERPGKDGPLREAAPPRSRSANVWMAPGARPARSFKVDEARSPEPSKPRRHDQRAGSSAGRIDKPHFDNHSDKRAKDRGGEGRSRSIRTRSDAEQSAHGDTSRNQQRSSIRNRNDERDSGAGEDRRSRRDETGRPHGKRKVRGKPQGERSFGAKPRGDRPVASRPGARGGDRPRLGPGASPDKPRPPGPPRGRPGRPKGGS